MTRWQLHDGEIVTLDGFGFMPIVMKPRTTENPGYPGSTTYPARPTEIGALALLAIDNETFVWRRRGGVSNTHGAWIDAQRRKLLDDEASKLTRFAPRVCTVRVFSHHVPNSPPSDELLPAFLLIDEALGHPILGIHNAIAQRGRMQDPRDRRIVFSAAIEWHPDGYSPPWLDDVV